MRPEQMGDAGPGKEFLMLQEVPVLTDRNDDPVPLQQPLRFGEPVSQAVTVRVAGLQLIDQS
jgi:hypothetical protein